MQKLMKSIIVLVMMMLGMSVAHATSYTIKRGDTLSEISLAHKTSIATLMELNPKIVNPDKIRAGDTLLINRDVLKISPAPGADSVGHLKSEPIVTTPTPREAHGAVATIHSPSLAPSHTVTATKPMATVDHPSTTPAPEKKVKAVRNSKPKTSSAQISKVDSTTTALPSTTERKANKVSKRMYWRNPGANKCVRCDLPKYLKRNFPEVVASELMHKVSTGDYAEIMITNGDQFDSMLFGHNVERKNVEAAFENGKPQPARAYTVTMENKEYVLVYPMICGNWSRQVREVTPPAPQATPVPDIPAAEPATVEPVCKTCPELKPAYIFPALPPGSPITDPNMVLFYKGAAQ